ncbi:hypothetical protein KAFR_0F01260 [Kazachstania africana CBS 2517]|uniref:Selenoprotein O n=1 Tax=Kazachstania africana (strain ATCC 22294 / BCRC 22015 / CBS 2517 / CECT 1963 / NBRC 1671 / NRRL Y-8276) TaxID=1071382 RepID=H2AWH2_KAZAF|nr:hypothetical protein KAFR_0F01260 [Kazachstania africana CBS 2517]CCF58722.1 hypothetical protein KAFR_0F01260 [Kazachstania africana CBS 2517]
MPEKIKIFDALRNSGKSSVIDKLTPDRWLPNVTAAINLVENTTSTDAERIKAFHTPRIVSKGSHFAFCLPTKRQYVRCLINSRNALDDFNLSLDDNLIKIFNGEKVYYDKEKNIFSYSLAYAGFQFGEFAGQLGDGRLVNLFDLPDKSKTYQTFQLKGCGITPFSRFGDGKAVLRSSIREFIISEALFNIGIPSTRAIQLSSLPGTKALRNGMEPCAVVCRFAPSWIRLGNFNLFRRRPDPKGLVALSDYCIENVFDNGRGFPKDIDLNHFTRDYFPDADENVAAEEHSKLRDGLTKYALFFRHVVNLNAECVAYWQAYGFLNGVLNTDNTSIMGISMDFGPFNFLDRFQPDFTPNHDDSMKRYSFENQPGVILWNLIQFAQDIALLLGADESMIGNITEIDLTKLDDGTEAKMLERLNKIIRLSVNEYKFHFTAKYGDLFAKRLGIDLGIDISNCTDQTSIQRVAEVITEFCSVIVEPLLKILQTTKIDYNNFFVNLQNYQGNFFDTDTTAFAGLDKEFVSIFFNESQIEQLLRFEKDRKSQLSNNGEIRLMKDILEDLKAWTKCYTDLVTNHQVRREIARKFNPLFIPRSWIFDQVIDDLTIRQKDVLENPDSELDTSLLQKLHLMSSYPYDPSKWDKSIRNDVVESWTTLEHSWKRQDTAKYMKQATCSS